MISDSQEKKRAVLFEKEAKWHVFYVQARHEKESFRQLTEDGFVVYLPLKKSLKIYSQRKKWVEEPLFNSYIFIRILPSQLYVVLQHPKVLRYIKFNDKAATIRDSHLELIKNLVKTETVFNVEKKNLEIGQEIKFESGPFRGHIGHILELRGTKKMLVKLDQLDYQLVVES